MWDIEINRSHKTPVEKVRAGVKKLLIKVGKKYNIKGSWSDPDNYAAEKGGHVEEGEVKLSAKKVLINIRFDFLGRLATNKIQKAIDDELDKIL